MEKGPEFRIVGDVSVEKKDKVKNKLEQALFNHLESLSPQEKEKLEKFEYPKSEKELAGIDFVNKETNKLMEEAGVKPYNIPSDNYHIIPPELYKKEDGEGDACTSYMDQAIFFDAQRFRTTPLYFWVAALHETIHLKGHLSIEVEEMDDNLKKTLYRKGVEAVASQRNRDIVYHAHFKGLHEAIVSIQEKKSLSKIIDLPEMREEKKWLMSDEAKELRKKLAEKIKIPEDDFIWVGKRGENDYAAVTYQEQRRVLNYVCAEIQNEFPNLYENADDVFKEFLKAHFTGRLLPIAHLVDGTFGEGSFRILGNMIDKESAVLTLETLKKARIRQTE